MIFSLVNITGRNLARMIYGQMIHKIIPPFHCDSQYGFHMVFDCLKYGQICLLRLNYDYYIRKKGYTWATWSDWIKSPRLPPVPVLMQSSWNLKTIIDRRYPQKYDLKPLKCHNQFKEKHASNMSKLDERYKLCIQVSSNAKLWKLDPHLALFHTKKNPHIDSKVIHKDKQQ